MGLPIQEQLKDKLVEFPLLRVLFYERWFRVAFGAFVFIFIFLGLFLPKIWRTTPKNFNPVVKVSGLDLLQAWSLKRTAVKATAAGKFEDANYAWQAALANNRADADLVRGALGCILKDSHDRKLAGPAIQEAYWLLKLTGTNFVDLELAGRTFERYHYFEPIITIVGPYLDHVQPALAAIYLKALFSQGRIQTDFNRRWTGLTQRLPALRDDPELRLFRDAYLIGWGPVESVEQARSELEAATSDPARRVLAYQLQLTLDARQNKLEDYDRVLKKLQELHEDSFSLHALYWGLLDAAGRKDEALKLLKAYPNPPSSPVEVAEFAELDDKLGLTQDALQVLHRYSAEYGDAPVIWITQANLLAKTRNWEELRNLAFQIRGQDVVRDPLLAFSYFLEGRAELALGGTGAARNAFEKAAEHECPYLSLSFNMASQFVDLGYGDFAQQVLARLEKPPLAKELSYWLLVFRAADLQKNVDLLLKAAAHAYELAPDNPAVINNYAAALIINRKNPEQAIKLTVQLLAAAPDSLHAMVNHSAALLLNDRPKEAEELLSRVKTNGLNRVQLALYNLDLFETYSSLEQYDRAWSVSDHIETDLLYPNQRKWLDLTRQKLPQRQKAG
jgi:predicted Zn-dependent protease